MKIKRFFAKEMRHGIRQVRETLGPDAVILSNTRVNGGVEIIAAVDYDESLLQSDPGISASRPLAETDVQSLHGQQLPELNLSALDEPQPQGEIPRPSPAETAAAKERAAATTTSDTPAEPGARSADSIQWTQDPTLTKMQSDLHDMRELLEQQMSSLAWGELSRRDPMRAKLTRCLLELGLSPAICKRVVEGVGQHDEFENAWRHALAMLAHGLPVDSTDILDHGGIVALVGATGVGKTTTVAKLAARYALRHGADRVAMVTTDSYRIAAHEQLRTYGRILDIPVRVANNHEELVESLELLADRDLVLIDTAGMSQRDVRLTQQFQVIRDSAPTIKTYLVLSTTTHRAGLREVVKAFGEVKLDGCILTKLDETTSLGGALSAVMENRLPVVYASDGQKVPEDIHIARGHGLINQAVLIAQETNQALEQETLELAFSGMVANAHG